MFGKNLQSILTTRLRTMDCRSVFAPDCSAAVVGAWITRSPAIGLCAKPCQMGLSQLPQEPCHIGFGAIIG